MATADVAISSSNVSSLPGAINVSGFVPSIACNTPYHVYILSSVLYYEKLHQTFLYVHQNIIIIIIIIKFVHKVHDSQQR